MTLYTLGVASGYPDIQIAHFCTLEYTRISLALVEAFVFGGEGEVEGDVVSGSSPEAGNLLPPSDITRVSVTF